MWSTVSSIIIIIIIIYYQFNDDTMQLFFLIFCKENMQSELKKSNRIVPLTNLNKCVYHDQSDAEVNTYYVSENKYLKNTTIM